MGRKPPNLRPMIRKCQIWSHRSNVVGYTPTSLLGELFVGVWFVSKTKTPWFSLYFVAKLSYIPASPPLNPQPSGWRCLRLNLKYSSSEVKETSVPGHIFWWVLEWPCIEKGGESAPGELRRLIMLLKSRQAQWNLCCGMRRVVLSSVGIGGDLLRLDKWTLRQKWKF